MAPLAFLSLLEVRLILSAIGVNHLLPMDCVVSLMSIVLIGNLIYSAASVTHMFCHHIEYYVSCGPALSPLQPFWLDRLRDLNACIFPQTHMEPAPGAIAAHWPASLAWKQQALAACPTTFNPPVITWATTAKRSTWTPNSCGSDGTALARLGQRHEMPGRSSSVRPASKAATNARRRRLWAVGASGRCDDDEALS